MIFTPAGLEGAWFLDLEAREDDRGFFARTWCADELRAHGIDPVVAQANMSYNVHAGTLRGMHMQDESAPEPKLIRCTRGRIWDVIVDMRPGSSTYLQHIGVELSEENHRQLYVPALCAHGFLTLEPRTEVAYLVGHAYAPGAERGYRYDDPAFGIEWPRSVEVISPKDAGWPLLDPQEASP